MMELSKNIVLLVDDEPSLLYSYARLLRDDYDVKRALHGRQALEIMKGTPIDCIVLDLAMPGMNGIEFLETIRKEGNAVPVVVVTGKNCPESAEACDNLNVSGYIRKPCSVAELRVAVGAAIGRGGEESSKDGVVAAPLPLALKRALDYIGGHYSSSLAIKTVSKKSGLSPDHLGRLFRTRLGVTFTGYVNRLRIDRAKELLEEGDFKLFDIMCQVGYKTEQHFFRQFKEYTGTTPRMFKEKRLEAGANNGSYKSDLFSSAEIEVSK